MEYTIRKLSKEEYGVLEDFLYEAIFVPEGMAVPPKSIINQPELQVYISGFGQKKDDIGLLAEVRIANIFEGRRKYDTLLGEIKD